MLPLVSNAHLDANHTLAVSREGEVQRLLQGVAESQELTFTTPGLPFSPEADGAMRWVGVTSPGLPLPQGAVSWLGWRWCH